MGDVSEAAEAKACELLNYKFEIYQLDAYTQPVLEQIESVGGFIQAASDAAAQAKAFTDRSWNSTNVLDLAREVCGALAPFILTEPVDPIVEVLRETYGGAAPEFVSAFHENLAKRGLKIVGADQ